MHKKATAIGMAFGILLSVTSLAGARAEMEPKPAVDKKGDNAVDKKGDCVITKWMSDTYNCGKKKEEPAPEPVVERKQPEPSPIRALTREEKTVYFAFDKHHLDADAKARLDTMTRAIKSSSDVEKVEIVGYADHIGTVSYNQKLSKKRADAVARYLIDSGVANTEVMDVRALGELSVSDNCKGVKPRAKLIACMRTDRRVEVEINYIEEQPAQ
jgi:outer membrane protein OmpA-like peptidoglycan-associated protein